MPPDERRVRQTSQTVFVAAGQLPVRHRAAAVTMDGARPGGLLALRHKVSSRRSPCAESGVGCNDPLQREAAGAGVACEGLLLLGTGASRLRIVARFMARGSGRPGGDSSGRMWLAVVAWGGVRVVRNDPMGGGPGGWAGADGGHRNGMVVPFGSPRIVVRFLARGSGGPVGIGPGGRAGGCGVTRSAGSAQRPYGWCAGAAGPG